MAAPNSDSESVLIALGGNAILSHDDEGTAEQQMANVQRTAEDIVAILREGYHVAVTHGNGPQVGDILLKNDIAKDKLPPMPLDVCSAESQGMIGYMLQQSLYRAMRSAGIKMPVVSVITQTRVDPNDDAFQHPTKPIGPYYSQSEAEKLKKEKGWAIVNDAGRGYRRVVPSPTPQGFLEDGVISALHESGVLVVASGGGGVPVAVDSEGRVRGVEGVIDKDRAAAVLGGIIGARTLLILTDVSNVYVNYGKKNQMPLERMTASEAEDLLEKGEFAQGSMKPKVESCIRFVRQGGKRAIVTSIDMAVEALRGEAGTTILP
jgi:carbamate kinase